MWEIWFFGGAITLVIGLCAASVILTATRKEDTPMDQILARQAKMDALIESSEIWMQIGLPYEAQACIEEAKRLNAEVYEIMHGENP